MRPLFAGGTGGQTIKESLGWARLSLPADGTLLTDGQAGMKRAGWIAHWTVGHTDMKHRKNREQKSVCKTVIHHPYNTTSPLV